MKDVMRICGKIYLILGILFILMPFVQLSLMEVKRQESLQQWENVETLDQDKAETFIEANVKGTSGEVFGTLSFRNESILPIIEGINPSDLEKGLGHDPVSVLPGEVGNCLIYGHREQYLWNIQFLNENNLIQVKTQSGNFIFQINQIEVMGPTDSRIFEETPYPSLTVVTCYPFVYFGKTEDRFVIKAMLIS